jgi:hypothetical protein
MVLQPLHSTFWVTVWLVCFEKFPTWLTPIMINVIKASNQTAKVPIPISLLLVLYLNKSFVPINSNIRIGIPTRKESAINETV